MNHTSLMPMTSTPRDSFAHCFAQIVEHPHRDGTYNVDLELWVGRRGVPLASQVEDSTGSEAYYYHDWSYSTSGYTPTPEWYYNTAYSYYC